MKSTIPTTLLISVLPSLIVSALFFGLLGHRRDYLGHYAAGYGGTLCALAIVLALIPNRWFARISTLTILPATLLCIAAGTITEATIFRLAKFDEIDYCNQNLGAILAGLVTMFIVDKAKPADNTFRFMIATGVTFLGMGGYFAVT